MQASGLSYDGSIEGIYYWLHFAVLIWTSVGSICVNSTIYSSLIKSLATGWIGLIDLKRSEASAIARTAQKKNSQFLVYELTHLISIDKLQYCDWSLHIVSSFDLISSREALFIYVCLTDFSENLSSSTSNCLRLPIFSSTFYYLAELYWCLGDIFASMSEFW